VRAQNNVSALHIKTCFARLTAKCGIADIFPDVLKTAFVTSLVSGLHVLTLRISLYVVSTVFVRFQVQLYDGSLYWSWRSSCLSLAFFSGVTDLLVRVSEVQFTSAWFSLPVL
jgi:hypothetical protein